MTPIAPQGGNGYTPLSSASEDQEACEMPGPYDPMDLKALRCFDAMAKHGSLTRAGIELGISDAAVSQRIKSLENHLGVKIRHR